MILLVDQKKLTVTIKIQPSETFTPSEEVDKLAIELKSIKDSQNALSSRLQKLLGDCHEWNRKNDSAYEKNVQENIALEKAKKALNKQQS